jgi:hypothetical protein
MKTAAILSLAFLSLAACASTHEHRSDVHANTKCPISAEAVSPDSYYEYQGHKIFVCCDDCLAAVAKDPAAAYAVAYK